MKKMYDRVAGSHPEVNYSNELKLWDTVIEANKVSLLEAAKDVNVGGIAIALAKMAVVGKIGVEASISLNESRDIFSESLSRAIVEVKPENCSKFEELANLKDINISKIGLVQGNKISINDIYKELDEASDVYFNKFKRVIEQDL